MQKVDIQYLLEKYKAGTCTPEEFELLENWYLQWNPDEAKVDPERLEQIKEEVWQILLSRNNKEKKIHKWVRVAAAAAIIFSLSAGAYFFLQTTDEAIQQAQLYDVEPGGNKAILTLADGSNVVLDSIQTGVFAKQGNTQIIKSDSGQLVYSTSLSKGSKNLPGSLKKGDTPVQMNTLTTPRAGQYRLVLPDSSIAFLDAFSSIRFPTAFNGQSREVTTTGQVYFEVAHDEHKPFKVTTKGQTIRVLGTHFNINAYDDEAVIKTTLLEGSIEVSSLLTGQSSLIVPGQQSVIDTTGNIKIESADIDEITAWKDGYFRFNNVDLPSIMRQFSRWYDIEIVYENQNFPQQFNGKITRNASLSRVLKILELGGVKFRIEEKKLIVISDESYE